MKTVTVEQLQKNLQALANQKGAAGYARAKALYMQDVMVVDMDGNPVDDVDVTISLPPSAEPAVETDSEGEDKPKEDEAKNIAAQVRAAIQAERKNAKPATKAAVKVESPKVYGRLRAFKSVDEAYRFGRWAMACIGSTKSAQWCADHDILVTKGHTENVNTAGGYLVPDEFENSLITLRDQFGVFRQNARIVPMSSDVKRMPRRNGTVTAFFVGEASAGTQSQQQFDQVNLVAKKLMVLSKISSELNEDNVVSLGDELASEISYAFALKEDQCGFNGNASSTFGGIIGLQSAILAGGTVSHASDTILANVTLGECRQVVGRLAQWADTPNTKWYINRAIWNNVFLRLSETAGGVTANEIRTEDGGLQFFGYPVVLAQAIPAPSNDGDPLAYFGDLSLAAYLGDRRSTTVEFSNAALNAFEQDELVVRGTSRFDINVANVGDASVAGAMVKFTL
jgi:HK97 family phage major capsid protein